MLENHHGNSAREDILNHGLDKDVNAFLAHYADKPARLLKNLHFVPQWFYYVNGKPSIVLKQRVSPPTYRSSRIWRRSTSSG